MAKRLFTIAFLQLLAVVLVFGAMWMWNDRNGEVIAGHIEDAKEAGYETMLEVILHSSESYMHDGKEYYLIQYTPRSFMNTEPMEYMLINSDVEVFDNVEMNRVAYLCYGEEQPTTIRVDGTEMAGKLVDGHSIIGEYELVQIFCMLLMMCIPLSVGIFAALIIIGVIMSVREKRTA